MQTTSAEKKFPRVWFSLVTWNGKDDLPGFFDTFLSSTQGEEYGFVIVDNNSSDTTREIIREKAPDAVVIELKENTGYAGGHNVGFTYAIEHGAEFVMPLNQDMEFLQKGWVSVLVGYLETHEKVAVVQPLIMLSPEHELVNSCGNAMHYLGIGYTKGYRMRPEECEKTLQESFFYCSGAAMMMRAEVLKRVGTLDGRYFMYHEESDLCWRFRLAGYDCAVEPRVQVFHRYEFSRSIKKFYYIERNRICNLLKNYELHTLLLIAPMGIIFEAGMLAQSILNALMGKTSIVFTDKMRCYAYFFLPSTWRYLRAERRKVSALRKVKDRAIISHITDQILFQDIENVVVSRIANPMMKGYWKMIKRCI